MPKLGQKPVTAVAAPAAPPERAPVHEGFPHAPADHISFLNADGTRSRICICPCDRCWPPRVGNPGPCPDWNDEDV